jgi:hypothetical protein
MAKAIYLMTLSLLVAMMNGVKTLKLVWPSLVACETVL